MRVPRISKARNLEFLKFRAQNKLLKKEVNYQKLIWKFKQKKLTVN